MINLEQLGKYVKAKKEFGKIVKDNNFEDLDVTIDYKKSLVYELLFFKIIKENEISYEVKEYNNEIYKYEYYFIFENHYFFTITKKKML